MRLSIIISSLSILLCFSGCAFPNSTEYRNQENTMTADFFDPENYSGSDVERINAALADAGKCGGTVRITPKKSTGIPENERHIWLVDSAVLLPGNVHLIIDNCTLKRSDLSRDNIIRSANCIANSQTIPRLKNIRITGINNAVIEGADVPRSTGDYAKLQYKPGFVPESISSFGSDAGKAGEYQKGDWRNISVLLAKVDKFTIDGLKIRDSHCWAVVLEQCTDGNIRNLEFDSNNGKMVNGKWELFRNQDGLDLLRGCHDITIENISGHTGDDLIAICAIGNTRVGNAGITGGGQFLCGDKNVSDGDIYNITIRNVRGYCAGGHHVIRFLNSRGAKIYNVIVDNVIDTAPAGKLNNSTIRIGDTNPAWGGVTPLGDTHTFIINNVVSNAHYPILITGSLQDSIISNIININVKAEPVVFLSGKENVKNVIISNTLTRSPAPAVHSGK